MPYKQLGHMGDGVYLSHDDYQFWLAVNDHENYVVALEPAVATRLMEAMVLHMLGADAPAYLRVVADNLDSKFREDI